MTGEYSATKQELTQKVATNTGTVGRQATSAVDAAFAAIASELAVGSKVAIAGCGKFSLSERSAREGRNRRPARRSRSLRVASRSSRLARR